MTKYENIKLIVLDVDGTLTDGGIYYDSKGCEIKCFDVKDGLGIRVALAAGLEIAIITGRSSSIVEKRARELGIRHLRHGIQQKKPALLKLAEELNIRLNEILYIGDDWNDMQCMKLCGLSFCPIDAPQDIQSVCQYVSKRPGGHGAVRECIEELLDHRDGFAVHAQKVYFV